MISQHNSHQLPCIPGRKGIMWKAHRKQTHPTPFHFSHDGIVSCFVLELQLARAHQHFHVMKNWKQTTTVTIYFILSPDSFSIFEVLKTQGQKSQHVFYQHLILKQVSFELCYVRHITFPHSLVLPFTVHWALIKYQLCARKSESIIFPLTFITS